MIAIPNMEKPKSCEYCRFYVDKWCYALEVESDGERRWLKGSLTCPLIEIVTCKECKYWHDDGIMTTCDKNIGHGFPSDYFCADGERRSE